MEYTIKGLADLAGITTRTLRYYDEVGILKPARINTNGYRMYGSNEVMCLQQIMFYKELGFDLVRMKHMLNSPTFDMRTVLDEHLSGLLEKRNQIDQLIQTVTKTILETEGKIKMKDNEKFQGFKEDYVKKNQETYGSELEKKYGKEVIEKSNDKFMGMSMEEYNSFKELEDKIIHQLREIGIEGAVESDAAKELFDMHKEWLMYTWTKYSKEAHLGLAMMYTEDPRFTSYYDAAMEGGAEKLKEIIAYYTR